MKRILGCSLVLASAAIQLCARGDGAEDQGGAGSQQPEWMDSAEYKTALAAAVAKETEGLKNNRNDVFNQLQAAKTQLAKFGDADPEAVKQILQRFESEEEQQLVKDGKIDQVVELRVNKMREKFNQDLDARDAELSKSIARQNSLENRAIAAEITKAATEAGAIPSALTDFVQRSAGNFSLTEDGDVIAVDKEGNQLFDVDGKTPLSAKAWALSLQKEAPHLFQKPNSGGSQGSQGGHPVGKLNGTQAEREAYFANKFKVPLK